MGKVAPNHNSLGKKPVPIPIPIMKLSPRIRAKAMTKPRPKIKIKPAIIPKINIPDYEMYEKDIQYKNMVDETIKYFSGKEPGNILVIECCEGLLCGKIKSLGFKVCGLDIDQDKLKIAREKNPGIEFTLADYMEFPFNYDYIISLNVNGPILLKHGFAAFIDKIVDESAKGFFVAIKENNGDGNDSIGFEKEDVNEIVDNGLQAESKDGNIYISFIKEKME